MEELKFVNTDTYAILQEVLSTAQKIYGKTIYEGQPEYSGCSLLAYMLSLTNVRINEASKSQLLEFSKAPVIDSIASLLGVERLPANKASCTLRFNLVDGHLQVLLPLGTRVSSSDGSVIFETIDDITIPVGLNVIDVTAQCQTAGKIGNNYAIDAINVIQDPYAFIQSVSNIDITKGGSDEESDDTLRERIKLAPASFSVAGSRNAYIYWAKSASPLITDIAVVTLNDFMPITSPQEWVPGRLYNPYDVIIRKGVVSVCINPFNSTGEPIDFPDCWVTAGQVHIFALLENGEVTNQSMNDIIASKLTSEDVRPLTDSVFVQSASIVKYSLKIDAVKTKKPDGTLTNKITTAINNYIKTYSLKLGFDIVKSRLESLAMVENIYDVKVTIYDASGQAITGNLSIKNNQVSRLTGLIVNITETNE